MPIEFAEPRFLNLLLLLPLWALLVWPWAIGGVLFSRGEFARGLAGAWHGRAALVVALPRLLRMGAMASLVLALAHPRRAEVVEESVLTGKGMTIAVDISTSMLAEDMENRNTRMAVARDAAVRFAQRRQMDELSLVAFAGQAVTRVPPTTDADLIVAGVETLEPQLVLDGTDISSAMLMSMTQLQQSERDERVIVLLTDGAHNGTGVHPLVTARAAAAFGMRVHSIALLGEPDLAGLSPMMRAAQMSRLGSVEAQMETVLTAISRMTGGQYFRASTEATLDSIYREIDALEPPSEVVVERTVYRSLRLWLLIVPLLLIGVEAALRASPWGLVP